MYALNQIFERPRTSILDDFFQLGTSTGYRTPAMDVKETESKYTVIFEVPGLAQDELTINFENGLLTLDGKIKEQEKEESENWYHKEIREQSFKRSLRFNDEIDSEKLSATLRNGILYVDLPKSEKAQKKTVQITVN